MTNKEGQCAARDRHWRCVDRHNPPRFSETTIGQRIITRASTPLCRFKMFVGAIITREQAAHSHGIYRKEDCPHSFWRKGTMLWPELRIFGLILCSRIVGLIVQIGSEYRNWQPYCPFLSNMHRFASCALFKPKSFMALRIIPMPIEDELLKPPQH